MPILSRPHPEFVELEAALQRAYGLSARDQLTLFSTLHDYLLAADGLPAGIPEVVLERGEALAVMSKVAEHLGLTEGRSPTTTEFKAGVEGLKLSGMSPASAALFARATSSHASSTKAVRCP